MISLISFLIISGSSFHDSSAVNIDSILSIHYPKNLNSVSFAKGDIVRLPVFIFDLGNGYHFFNSEDSFQTLRDFLIRNPYIICELRTHTDTRGSAEANLKLSLHRSIRIKEEFFRLYKSDTLFLERLIPVGKGESEPIISESYINQFITDKYTIEFLHAVNRRYELCIQGFLGSNFYMNNGVATQVFSKDNLRNPAYYEDLILIADRALLEGDYLKALEYYTYAADVAPVHEIYAAEQRDKIKQLLNTN